MRHRRIARLLTLVAATVTAVGVLPASPAAAMGSCELVPQKPWTANNLTINWGALVICDSVIVNSTFVGTLENVGGLILDVKAGPSTSSPSSLQFWSNTTACPLSDSYRSVILRATFQLADGSTVNMGPMASGFQFVRCVV